MSRAGGDGLAAALRAYRSSVTAAHGEWQDARGRRIESEYSQPLALELERLVRDLDELERQINQAERLLR